MPLMPPDVPLAGEGEATDVGVTLTAAALLFLLVSVVVLQAAPVKTASANARKNFK